MSLSLFAIGADTLVAIIAGLAVVWFWSRK